MAKTFKKNNWSQINRYYIDELVTWTNDSQVSGMNLINGENLKKITGPELIIKKKKERKREREKFIKSSFSSGCIWMILWTYTNNLDHQTKIILRKLSEYQNSSKSRNYYLVCQWVLSQIPSLYINILIMCLYFLTTPCRL